MTKHYRKPIRICDRYRRNSKDVEEIRRNSKKTGKTSVVIEKNHQENGEIKNFKLRELALMIFIQTKILYQKKHHLIINTFLK